MKYNQKKNQSIETHPEVREMIELADKTFFKLSQLCSRIFKIRNIVKREMKDFFKKQLEVKYTISEMKKFMNGLNR